MFKNLELEMFKKDVSITFLAKEMGISESAMRNKLKGQNEFKFSEIQKLLKFFPACDWNYLFAQEPPERRVS